MPSPVWTNLNSLSGAGFSPINLNGFGKTCLNPCRVWGLVWEAFFIWGMGMGRGRPIAIPKDFNPLRPFYLVSCSHAAQWGLKYDVHKHTWHKMKTTNEQSGGNEVRWSPLNVLIPLLVNRTSNFGIMFVDERICAHSIVCHLVFCESFVFQSVLRIPCTCCIYRSPLEKNHINPHFSLHSIRGETVVKVSQWSIPPSSTSTAAVVGHCCHLHHPPNTLPGF